MCIYIYIYIVEELLDGSDFHRRRSRSSRTVCSYWLRSSRTARHVSLHIYIYIHMCMCLCYKSLSLSMYAYMHIYIYIYTYIYTCVGNTILATLQTPMSLKAWRPPRSESRASSRPPPGRKPHPRGIPEAYCYCYRRCYCYFYH